MSEYAKASAAVNGSPVPAKARALCCVSGCQLPGTTTSNTLGASEWFCRLHFSATYADQGKITALSANRIALYRLAFKCTNVPPGRSIPPELKAALKRHNRLDLLDSKLTLRSLGRRMLEILDGECVTPQQRMDVDPEPQQPRPTWTPVADLAGVFAE